MREWPKAAPPKTAEQTKRGWGFYWANDKDPLIAWLSALYPWIATNMSWTPDFYIIRAATDIQAFTPISITKAKGTPGTEKSLETQQVFGGQVSLMGISKVSSKLFGFGEYWFSDIACSKWRLRLRSWTFLLERAGDSVGFFLARHFARPLRTHWDGFCHTQGGGM